MILLNGKQINVTIFPDKTSQCWKLENQLDSKPAEVVWFFENEAELIHLAQLKMILRSENVRANLKIPYLPYARQDKEISNESTFALRTFASILNLMSFEKIEIVDAHSDWAIELIKCSKDKEVIEFHKVIIDKVKPTYIVFPDKGACNRYHYLAQAPHIVFEKNRDQSTGQILGHKMLNAPTIKSGNSFLIVDDICDGGATFTSISKALHEVKANIRVDLCVTHGLFSKGKQVLEASGINEIHTTNSLLRNKDGYKVC